jgi:hypothetical protein
MSNQNVAIGSDTVTVSGGQSFLNVDVNFGNKGDDGSVILYGAGKPQNLSINSFPRTPRILDWYINTDSTDDEYLYIYQYIYTNNETNWARVFKIIPNVYQTNKIVSFKDGIGSANIIVSNTTLPLIPQVEFPTSGSTILPVDDEDEMIGLSTTVGNYAFRKDLGKYYYLRQSPPSVASNWEGLITVNAHVNVENNLPVTSSFQLGRPDIIRDQKTDRVISYVLPILVVAYQVVPPPTPDKTVAAVSDLTSVVPLGLGPDMIYSVYVTNANSIYILAGPDPSVLQSWIPFSPIQPFNEDKTVHISINVI